MLSLTLDEKPKYSAVIDGLSQLRTGRAAELRAGFGLLFTDSLI